MNVRIAAGTMCATCQNSLVNAKARDRLITKKVTCSPFLVQPERHPRYQSPSWVRPVDSWKNAVKRSAGPRSA